MSEEKNGMSPENNVTPAAETPQERPKRGRPRKVDANGNPVAPRRRGRPPKTQTAEAAPAAVAPQTAPAEEKAPQTEETKPRRGRKPAVRQQSHNADNTRATFGTSVCHRCLFLINYHYLLHSSRKQSSGSFLIFYAIRASRATLHHYNY